jgi:uncharacterized membrane protein YfhO
LQVEGAIPEGRVISLQVNYDPGWRASQDRRPIPIERDRLGFMVLRANPSDAAHVELSYRGTLEQWLMAVLSALCWIGSIVALWLTRRAYGALPALDR